MRIAFVGTLEFSRHCLLEVLASGGDVVGVITLDERAGRFNSDYVDLSPIAKRFGVPVHRVQKIGDPACLELVRSLEPDIIFVFGLSQLVPKEILDIPPFGCIGSHPALLPKDRGRHPLIWALVKGYEQSGLTFFYLDEGADSGDILWQKPFSIGVNDDSAVVYEKIKLLASDAIREFLPQLECGNAPRIPQDSTRATYLRKRGEKDGEIDWAKSSLEVHNLVRGLSHPYVGAHTFAENRKVVIWRTQLPEGEISNGIHQPGTTFDLGESLRVVTGDGFVMVNEYEITEGEALNPGLRLGSRT